MTFESKTTLLTAFTILVFAFSLNAQNQETDGREITSYNPFEVASDYANFSECTSNNTAEKRACFTDKLQKFFNKNLKMPKDSISQNFDGKVYFKFFTDTKGKLESKEIFNTPDSKFIEEKIDLVLKKTPSLKVVQLKDTSVSTGYVLYAKFSPREDIRLRVIDIIVNKENLKKTEEKETNDIDGLEVFEDRPIFPGCEEVEKNRQRSCFDNKMSRHIRKNFRLPVEAEELGIDGRITIMFSIAKDGYIKNITTSGPHPLLELEGRTIIAKLPRMTPAKHKGKPVSVPYSLPITFKIN